ncbi:MAG: hypothetical protein PHU08_00135 [Dehalococcoidales bacterium]|nr:hypothetical protein [Dehalococcoidales bacterium]
MTEREQKLLEFLRKYCQQLAYGRMSVAITVHEGEPVDVEISEMRPKKKL